MRRELPMILIRVAIGLVFLIEGALKFVFPDEFGVAFFASCGIPFANLVAPCVGGVEIAGGILILLSFFAGDAALVLLLVMISTLVTTKIPILLGRPLGPFVLLKLPHYGFLSFLHEARVEVFLIFATLAVIVDSGLQIGHQREWYQERER
jgi:uncharacterized membrane protein YphA (DoxX/SURF4 family)